jgi:hypothetical protein
MYGYGKAALMEMGRKHWRTYLPAKYKALQQAGTLRQELEAAAALTLDAMDQWQAMGVSLPEAWQATREQYLILPAEAEEDEEEIDNPMYDAIVEMNQAREAFDPDDD